MLHQQTYPEPPGHAEDHLWVILRREQRLSEGKRRRGGEEDSVSQNNVATTVSGMAGYCFTDRQPTRTVLKNYNSSGLD